MVQPPKPLVSVVTPTFNSERYLERTILSVLEQSHEPVEHLIVDGGSTDGTLAIVARYPHLTLIQGRDRNMYDALNKGLKAAQGEIIGCLNSDDQYAPGALAAVVAAFERDAASDVVFGHATFVDEADRRLFDLAALPFSWRRFAALDFSSLCFSSVFWRRGIHERVGYFNDDYSLAADFDFYLRFKPLRLRRLPRVLSLFRNHAEAQTYTKQGKSREEVARILAAIGVHDSPLQRLKWQIGKVLFILVCYRPPLVMLRRGVRKLGRRLAGARP